MPVPSVQICAPPPKGASLASYDPSSAPLRTVKLGRRPRRPGQRAPRLARYLRGGAEPLPEAVDYAPMAAASISQIYGNDDYGDCVIADQFHAVGVWSGNDAGKPIVGTTKEAVAEYHRICGPGDNGCVITDVLDAMASGGLKVAGKARKILGYAELDPAHADLVKTAILTFGGMTIGFNVPQQWLGRGAYAGAVWDDPGARFTSAGGHDMLAVGYNATGAVFATWGFTVTMTWRALANARVVDEAYVKLSEDWTGLDLVAPSRLDLGTLKSDLEAIRRGETPDWQPPEPPVPPVVDPPPEPPVPPVDPPPIPPTPSTDVLVMQRGRPVAWSASPLNGPGQEGWVMLHHDIPDYNPALWKRLIAIQRGES